MQGRHPTAQRIVDVALRLFADHGLDATPITRIEAEAGLAPGSGAFYKHFRTKEDVLRAARRDMAGSVPEAGRRAALETLPIADQLELIAHGVLASFDEHRDLVLAGLRLPADHGLFDDTDSVGARGVQAFERWLAHHHEHGTLEVEDPAATATLLLGGLFSHWLSGELSTSGDLGLERDRVVATWVRLALAATGPPTGPRR